MATHKESSYGGQRDEDEDAVRMGVETKILCYTAGSTVTLVMSNVLLHSFLLSSNKYKLSHWCQELGEVLGVKGKHALMVLRTSWMRQN